MLHHVFENTDYLAFALCALGTFAALHVWLVRRGAAGLPLKLVVLVLGLLIIGGAAVDHTGHRAADKLQRAITGMAPTYALEIERLGHAHVTLATPADDPAYRAIIDAQLRWLAVNPNVNDIYTFRVVDDQTVALIVDSETDYNRDGRFNGEREVRTAIGETLEVSSPLIRAALSGRGGLDPETYTDRWGTWVSAYWPLRNSVGAVEAVLGVDFQATNWLMEIRNARLAGMASVAIVLLILFAAAALASMQRMEIKSRERIADALRAARDAAESASALKSQFLACMSHEIRTPMNGVMGVTELLLETKLDTKQREFSNLIYRSAATLLSVINDVLDYSKIEADKLSLENSEFDPRETIEDIGELLSTQAHHKGLRLNLDISPDLPTSLIGDAGRLRQVLINLVGNAVKFTERGEVDVICAWRAVAHTVTLRCEVRDTGAGIETAALETLFEPFVQADSSITRRYGGTGLGLTISKRLVELMGGQIVCESAPGQGTKFIIEVPFERGITTPTGLEPRAGARDLRGVRVLVVDDNDTNREILEHLMAAWGMRATSASSAQDALTLIAAANALGEPYQLAVLDRDMPGRDGLQLTTSIRADPANIGMKLLMLSSASDLGDTAQWRAVGINVYLTKPVRHAALFRALCNLLRVATEDQSLLKTWSTAQPIAKTELFAGELLLAEDNAVNQIIAVEMLTALGFTVTAVEDGQAALEAIVAAPLRFQAVLMDCEMPRLDGRSATAKIRAFEFSTGHPRLPIIALTAHAADSDRGACLGAGMDDYLSKPFTQAQLAETLARWCAETPSTTTKAVAA